MMMMTTTMKMVMMVMMMMMMMMMIIIIIIIIIMHGARMAWRNAPRQQRHSHLNDIIWRAMKRAQIPAVKEPVGLMRQDGKRPDGTTILP